MKLTKKGAISVQNIVVGVVLLIVTFIITFLIVGNTAGTLTDAADNISGSGLPLAGLFSSSGVVLLVFMAGLLVTLVVLAFSFNKR